MDFLERCFKLCDGDIYSFIILSEIAMYDSKKTLLDTQRENFNLFGEQQRGSNAHSISLSSGIPKETVRRKIKKIQTQGWVVKNNRKQLFISRQRGKELYKFTQETFDNFNCFIENMDKFTINT